MRLSLSYSGIRLPARPSSCRIVMSRSRGAAKTPSLESEKRLRAPQIDCVDSDIIFPDEFSAPAQAIHSPMRRDAAIPHQAIWLAGEMPMRKHFSALGYNRRPPKASARPSVGLEAGRLESIDLVLAIMPRVVEHEILDWPEPPTRHGIHHRRQSPTHRSIGLPRATGTRSFQPRSGGARSGSRTRQFPIPGTGLRQPSGVNSCFSSATALITTRSSR